MFKNILIPTDGSALSKKAITNGVKLARSLGAKVTGLWVAPGYDPQIYEDYVPANYMSPADYKVEIGKRAEQILSAVESGRALSAPEMLQLTPTEAPPAKKP